MLDVVAPIGGFTFETTEYDLGARRYHATGETLPDSVLDELRGTTRSCWARSGTQRFRRGCSSAGCCCGCGSNWTTTSTSGR